MQGYGLVKLL